MAFSLPPETPEREANRQRVSQAWLSAEQVAALLPPHCLTERSLTDLVTSNQILRVWCPHYDAWRYPDWQFGTDGCPPAELVEILSLLRGQWGVVTVWPTSGWQEIEWFLAPNLLLPSSPHELLTSDPQLVLSFARNQLSEASTHAGW